MINGLTKLVMLLGCAMLAGCLSVGPKFVSGSRTDYNVVLRQAEDQQMLLNLVRLRYRDPAMFLEMSALNTQFSVSGEVNGGTEFGDVDSVFGLGGKVIVGETPTVSYTPLRGSDFVERVLTPISPEILFLLDTSGWSSERLIRVLVDEINEVENATGANGPTPGRAPAYQQFKRLAFLLRQLEQQNLVEGARLQNQLVLDFDPEALDKPEYLEFTRILGLNPDMLVYPVVVTARGSVTDSINLRFRSFAGVMYFLSQSVEIPDEDITAGRVTVTMDDAGQPFDWQQVTEGLLAIKSSPQKPDNASVTINYRNSWFYIDDSDLESKSTFMLLGQVYQLQAGNVKSAAPMLTLPLGK
jgi:hypothetical protein